MSSKPPDQLRQSIQRCRTNDDCYGPIHRLSKDNTETMCGVDIFPGRWFIHGWEHAYPVTCRECGPPDLHNTPAPKLTQTEANMTDPQPKAEAYAVQKYDQESAKHFGRIHLTDENVQITKCGQTIDGENWYLHGLEQEHKPTCAVCVAEKAPDETGPVAGEPLLLPLPEPVDEPKPVEPAEAPEQPPAEPALPPPPPSRTAQRCHMTLGHPFGKVHRLRPNTQVTVCGRNARKEYVWNFGMESENTVTCPGCLLGSTGSKKESISMVRKSQHKRPLYNLRRWCRKRYWETTLNEDGPPRPAHAVAGEVLQRARNYYQAYKELSTVTGIQTVLDKTGSPYITMYHDPDPTNRVVGFRSDLNKFVITTRNAVEQQIVRLEQRHKQPDLPNLEYVIEPAAILLQHMDEPGYPQMPAPAKLTPIPENCIPVNPAGRPPEPAEAPEKNRAEKPFWAPALPAPRQVENTPEPVFNVDRPAKAADEVLARIMDLDDHVDELQAKLFVLENNINRMLRTSNGGQDQETNPGILAGHLVVLRKRFQAFSYAVDRANDLLGE